MIDSLESKITFEIPNNMDLHRLFRANNSFWQNLQQQNAAARTPTVGYLGPSGGAESVLFGGGDYNSSSGEFDLLSSIQNFASQHGGPAGLGPDGSEQLLDPTYERFIGDVWVGIVLTLMILSSIFCMCSCFLYHKFRQWQRSVLTARSQTLSSMDLETPPPYDVESLPSYTIVSGLPSYNDAIEQLKQKQQQYAGYEPVKVHRPSVIKLFESQSQDLLAGTAKLEEIRYNFVSNRPTSVGVEGTVTELAATTSSGNLEATATATTVTAASTATVVPPRMALTTTTTTTTTTSTIPPSGKSPAEFKKFSVSRYTLENERSNSGFSS